jgi:RNA polymerase sigma-70 factor (ECF subfamily)
MAVAESSDDELMVRLQEGDASAFPLLVERYSGRLVGFFCRNVRDRYLADDLTQETFLRVYEEAWDYIPLGTFRAWLFRIARNLMIDTIRKQNRDALVGSYRPSQGSEDILWQRIVADLVTPLEQVRTQELAAALNESLEELPEEQRLTFTLHHFGELKLQEISEILDIPLNTCKSRLRLAREKLSESLRQFDVDQEAHPE